MLSVAQEAPYGTKIKKGSSEKFIFLTRHGESATIVEQLKKQKSRCKTANQNAKTVNEWLQRKDVILEESFQDRAQICNLPKVDLTACRLFVVMRRMLLNDTYWLALYPLKGPSLVAADHRLAAYYTNCHRLCENHAK